MVTLKGIILGDKVTKGEKNGRSYSFRTLSFVEDGGSGEAIKISCSDHFAYTPKQDIEIDVELSMKGFSLQATLIEED